MSPLFRLPVTTIASRRDRVRLLLAAALIAAVVVPWTSYQDHAHWMNVRWIPFFSRPARPLDPFEKLRFVAEMAGNVLLYVPLGFAAYRVFGGWRTLALGLSLSALTEWTQLYSHSRIPSTTDIVCNLIGSWIGARIARRRPPAHAHSESGDAHGRPEMTPEDGTDGERTRDAQGGSPVTLPQ